MIWDHGSAMTPLTSQKTFGDDRDQYVKFDQITIYDHALTMFYGMNAYIFAVDHDEFLVLPQHVQPPVIHNTLLQGMGCCVAYGCIACVCSIPCMLHRVYGNKIPHIYAPSIVHSIMHNNTS